MYKGSSNSLSFELNDEYLIGGVTYDKTANADTELNFGTVSSAEINFTIKDADYIVPAIDGCTCTYYIQFPNDDVWVKMGVFTNRQITFKNNVFADIRAQDSLYKLAETDVKVTDTDSHDMLWYINDIADKLDVTVGDTDDVNNITGQLSEEQNATDVLSSIGLISGGFFEIDKDDKLCFKKYNDTSINIGNSDYLTYDKEPYNTQQIHQIVMGEFNVKDADVDYPYSTFVFKDYLFGLTHLQLIELFRYINSIVYIPGKVTLLYNHDINAGDIIHVSNNPFLVMSKRINSAGVELSCTGTMYRQ